MTRCAAPWLELNMSAPDNRVTVCCYYGGQTDGWSDDYKRLEDYWNSPTMRGLRRLQVEPDPPKGHGCSTCHLFANRPGGTDEVYSLETMPQGLSPLQEANWRLARDEFLAGKEVLNCKPARIYGNFGFACNISCTMCHQVPRRLDNRRTISADHLLGWAHDLEVAQEVHVIGGEPFVLPQAIKFIRGFIAHEERYEWVRLVIATNGTILHKHWDTLHRKYRLDVAVSLDGIGAPFEGVRLGASWADVERNVLRLKEAQSTDRPEWRIRTASLIQKSTLRNLPDFAIWHTRHGVDTLFSDFISAPGVEDTFHRENFLHNPHLLTEIPEWDSYFDEAIAVFRSAKRTAEVNNLTYFKSRVAKALEASAVKTDRARRQSKRNDWRPLQPTVPSVEYGDWSSTLTATAADGRGEVPLGTHQGMSAFMRTRLGDYLATPYLGLQSAPEGGHFRVRLHWPELTSSKEIVRRAHVSIQQHDGTEIATFREILDYGIGNDLILSGEIDPKTKALRVVITPVGEEVSVVPRRIEVDVDPNTTCTDWPVKVPELEQSRRFGLRPFMSFLARARSATRVKTGD